MTVWKPICSRWRTIGISSSPKGLLSREIEGFRHDRPYETTPDSCGPFVIAMVVFGVARRQDTAGFADSRCKKNPGMEGSR